MFRHTYCSTWLQALDHGEPVTPYGVGAELRHGGSTMVERVYAQMGSVRHRSDVVEYRGAQHAAILGERLERLRAAFVPVSVPGRNLELNTR